MKPQRDTPLPRPNVLSRPHWDGCREGKLKVQRCNDCGTHVFIPTPVCSSCMSSDMQWVETSGKGRVYSFTTVWRPQRPEFEVPYSVAIVEMEEGWHMLSNLIDLEPEDVKVGLAVEVVFHAASDEITLPYFRPAGA